jgi:YggT family protein
VGAWAVFVLRTIGFISSLLTLYFWVVIIAAVMTWIEPNPYNPIVRFIYSVTEPVFEWIREHLPVVFGGIDFSPLVVIFGIQIIQQVLLPTLAQALVGSTFA